jgi:NTE family protein
MALHWGNNAHMPRIGLALGGGGTRGTAHIGVLQSLEHHNIRPSCLSGTSAGAFVAALYSFGVPLPDIHELVVKLTPMQTVHFTFSLFGLLSNNAIGEILEEKIGSRIIEDAPIPLAIMTADICTGEKVVMRTGSVTTAVMASSALPGISVPVKIGNRLLVDGFIVENVPVSPLRSMGAEIIIAVNLGSERLYKPPEDIIDIVRNAFDISVDGNTEDQMASADVIIEPKVASYPRNDNTAAPTVIAEGFRATEAKMDHLQSVIHHLQAQSAPSLWHSILRLSGYKQTA